VSRPAQKTYQIVKTELYFKNIFKPSSIPPPSHCPLFSFLPSTFVRCSRFEGLTPDPNLKPWPKVQNFAKASKYSNISLSLFGYF